MKATIDERVLRVVEAARRQRDTGLSQSDEDALAWARAAFPRLADLPAGWRLIRSAIDGYHVVSADQLSVIVSGGVEADDRRWLHVSYARPGRMPDYTDTQRVRQLFLGEDRYCCAVWPPKDCYVNHHRYCLHLWACLDEWPLPEFSGLLGGVRSV